MGAQTEREAVSVRFIWLAGALWGGVLVSLFHAVRSDDAFISYRYGQNFAEGVGLVFNPGERILGATSPGHILLAGLVYRVAGAAWTPDLMAALGCLGWAAQGVAIQLLLARSLDRGALFVAAAVLLGASGAAAWVPLETHLAAALVLFAFASAERRRWTLALALAALAVLMRPDALIAATVLALWCCWELRGRAIGKLALLAGLLAPWTVFATLYYGSPLPESAVAKFQRERVGDYLWHELSYPPSVILPNMPTALQIAFLFTLVALATVQWLRRAPRLLPYLAYGLLHAAAYAVLRPFTLHRWHLYPWTLMLTVTACAALAHVALGLSAGSRSAGSGSRNAVVRALPVAAAIAGMLLLTAASLRFARAARTLAPSYWSGQRDAVYRDVARYVAEHAAPGERFASIEVGTIAYYSGLPAFDLGGLVTPTGESMADYPVRFIVLDWMSMRAQAPVAFRSEHGNFAANVHLVP